MTNAEILDRFKHRHDVASDYALATLLGVSVQVVSNFRKRETDTITTKMLEHELAGVKLPRV